METKKMIFIITLFDPPTYLVEIMRKLFNALLETFRMHGITVEERQEDTDETQATG